MATKPFDALEIVESLENVTEDDVVESALAVLANVVRGTPVGDPKIWQNPASAPEGYVGGHARRNWHVSLSSPVNTVKGSAGAGPGKGAATSEAITAGTSKAERFTAQKARIIIQNNVPYIVPLNNGHSTQAPKNFVAKAVQAGLTVNQNRREPLP